MDCRFADRDRFMQFRCGGIGHKSTLQAMEAFAYESPETQQLGDEMVELEILGPLDSKESEDLDDKGLQISNEHDEYGDDREGHDLEEDDSESDKDESEDDNLGEDELDEEGAELGPEDGEEDWEMDEGELLGFSEP
jgi:hypothetical protein